MIKKNEETSERNHLLAPRNVVNLKKLYTIYMLKELSNGNNFYGKEIYDSLQEHFAGFHVSISYSTIYNNLHDMEKIGYVISHWNADTALKNRTKRYYKITTEGINHYKLISSDTIKVLKQNKNLIQKFIELLE